MAEYIEKNDLREYIDGYIKLCNGKPIYTDIDALVGIIDLLEDMPAAEVQPVKRGRWLHINDDGIIFCSECENEAYWDTDYGQQLFDYCPYCGAKMKKP